MTCIGKDPRCPCQDGDACHYKDCGNTKAWPVPQAEPATCRFCHDKKGCWAWQCYHCGEIDDVQKPASPAAQPAPAPMSQPNRLIAYAAASKLQELGYEWVDDAWQQALAAPAPQRPWVGLTDDEIKIAWAQLWYDLNHGKLSAPDAEVRNNVVVFGQALEALLKEQNT